MSVLSGNCLSLIDRSDERYHALLDFHNRLARKDATIWGSRAAPEASTRMNWIDLPESSRELLPQLDALCAKHREKTHIILCGMGGSSLGPEVIARTYKRELFILDSTDPNYIAHALKADLAKTLVIVSSKSGSTIETASMLALFTHSFLEAGLLPSAHIVVVTDPGSALDRDSRKNGLTVINADPNVGGRFSVLGAFGLVPAALIGIDVSVLLDSASATKKRFLKDPQLVVDIAYAVAFLSTQYVNLCDDESAMPGLSDWIEQLIAESTGKDGVGKLPVVIETIDKSTGFSVAFCGSADLVVSADLASQFIIWEWVTALVCAALSIDPFNQPNVTEAKEVTAALLTRWAGTVPVFTPDACDENIEIFGDGQSIKEALTLLIQSIPRDGYISVMAYLDRRDDANISQIRALLSSKSARPVTFGWGPRLLHSTGQFHKGGTRNGAFLAITGEVEKEISIEGQSYGFKTLLTAQAMGDGQALHSRKYPLLRLHLNNRAVGIEKLISALKSL